MAGKPGGLEHQLCWQNRAFYPVPLLCHTAASWSPSDAQRDSVRCPMWDFHGGIPRDRHRLPARSTEHPPPPVPGLFRRNAHAALRSPAQRAAQSSPSASAKRHNCGTTLAYLSWYRGPGHSQASVRRRPHGGADAVNSRWIRPSVTWVSGHRASTRVCSPPNSVELHELPARQRTGP